MSKRWRITHLLRAGVSASAVLVCFAASHPLLAEVHYIISLASPQRHLVEVRMEIPRGVDVHELQLPVWNALYQVRDFSQYMNWIRAETSDGHALQLTPLNKSRWQLRGAWRGAWIVYEMFSDDPGSYGAQLNSQHAFFNLAEILLYADDLRIEPAQIEIRNLQPNWKVATPLLPQGSGYTAPNYDRLVDSPVEIGNFEEQDFTEPCGKYQVVLDRAGADAGGGAKSRKILAQMIPPLRRIVSAASAWMNDCPFQTYMFIYHASDSPGGGGMEHAYSTAITLPEKDFETISDRLMSISAHEFFHLWNVKRIRPQSLEPVDYTKANYTPALWFSEGVDSTVAEYLCLRARLFDEPRYLEHLSEEITELENRPAHLTQSVEQSSLDAWLEKYPYYGLPERSISYYNKGELLGVMLDLALRNATNERVSLRDLLRWMNEHYAKQGKFFRDSEAVREAAEQFSHADFDQFFRDYVSGTTEIPWERFFASVGLRVVRNQIVVADTGFKTVQKFDQPPFVVQVESGSEAERAGLKAGDAIIRVEGEAVEREFEKEIANVGPGEVLHLSVRREGIEHELRWKLESRSQNVFQLREVADVSPEQRKRRAAWLFDQDKTNPPQ